MALHMEEMNDVKVGGEQVDMDKWYHVRFSSVEEATSENSGEPVVKFKLKIQDEPFVGRVIPDFASLQPHALFKLKAYYEACEYFPERGQGHDPEKLLDRECYVKVTSKVYQGETRTDIKPHHIKPLREGRPQK